MNFACADLVIGADLTANTIYFHRLMGRDSSEIIDTLFGSASNQILFRGYDGSWQINARLIGGRFEIPHAGDITLLAGKSLDAYTNAGYVKVRRVSQAAMPTPETGEVLLWRDTDDDRTYLVYEDPGVGTRSIELT